MTKPMKKENDNTEHFSPLVPETLRDKLFILAKAAKDDFISSCGGGGYGCERINEIYGYHIPGFIPFQLGGFEISELHRSDQDTGYHFTKAQSESVDKAVVDMYKSFYRDHNLKEKGIPEDYGYDDIPDDLQNTFADYENDWLEPALLRLSIWVDDNEHELGMMNNSKNPTTVYIHLGLGYSDAPYYREKYDETLFQFNMPIDEIMAIEPDAFIKMLKEKLATVE